MQILFLASLTSLLSVVSSAAVCATSGITAARAAQVANAFGKAKLVPQAIPPFQPKVEVNVAYGSKKANLGTVYSTLETLTEPTIDFTAESDQDPATTKYVILFVDPDAPGPTQSGNPSLLNYFLHLAVYDASPNCISSAKNGGGKTLAMYKPLTPLSVSSHRYTQLVLRQPVGYQPPALDPAYLAGGLFNLNKFITDGELTIVGGNFFLQGLGNLGAVGK